MQNHFISTEKKNFATTIFKRFFAVYFFLYSLPFPLYYVPFLNIVSAWYFKVVNKVVVWTGTHLCGVPSKLLISSDGSSDTTFNYIRLGLFAVASALVVMVWSLHKPFRKFLNPALPAMMNYIRYYLAIAMLRYGFEKIIKAQFPFPYYNLNETYGESSPFRLFKSFMGFSLAYNVFLGLSEASAALLLLFKKTTVFGSLLSIIILVNIVALNFTFDLPVKMVSLIFLMMSFFVLIPERKLLGDFYRWSRLQAVENIIVPAMQNRQKKVWTGLKFIIFVCACYSISAYAWKLYTTSGDGAFHKASLFGIYNTNLFIRNGDTLQPLLTDATQWKALNIGNKQQASLKMMNDSMRYCRVTIDTISKTIGINDKEDTIYNGRFSYLFRDTMYLILSGKIKGDSVYIVMHKQDYNQYRLTNRRFHWISEYPYAR